MDALAQVVEEFLDLITEPMALGRLPLSDEALDCLPRLAGVLWAGSEDRLDEFVAAHPRFRGKLGD